MEVQKQEQPVQCNPYSSHPLETENKANYDELYKRYLTRITNMLKQNNPSLGQATNIQLEKPILEKIGTKKI